MRPMISYYGSKWRLVPKYQSPKHDIIVEAFAGGATYSLRHAHKQVILNDLDEKLAEVWRYLISAPAAEILNLPDLVPGQSVDTLDIPLGAKHLIGFWLNKGKSSPAKTTLRRARGYLLSQVL